MTQFYHSLTLHSHIPFSALFISWFHQPQPISSTQLIKLRNHLYDFFIIFCVVSVQTCGWFVNVNFACWYFALRVWSLGQEEPLEEGSATHSGILAWGIPWTEEPTGLQSMGLQRVGHDWSGLVCTHFVELVLTVFVCVYVIFKVLPS